MKLSDLYLLVACCTLGSITGVSGLAPPRRYSDFRLERRQDDLAPDSEVDPAGTGKLRDCKPPRPIYLDQEKVEWNEVNKDKTKLEVTQTTGRNEKAPVPKDTEQGHRFVIDHVLELAVVQSAFDDKNREYDDNAKGITDDAWKKAKNAVNGDNKGNCAKLADKITVLDNLLGVAERINLGKEAAYQKVLAGKTNENLDSKWNNYLKAIKGYLEDFKTKVDTTIDNTAQALQDLTGEEKAKTYFGDYCKAKYKEGQDYVSDQVDKLPDDGGDDDSAGGECLADGADCTGNLNGCCSKMCTMDKGLGALTCQ